jgi:hypothetical protein
MTQTLNGKRRKKNMSEENEKEKEKQKLPFDIHVDTELTAKMARESERLRIENEQLKNRLLEIARKEIERKLDANSITDEEQRKFYHDHPNQFAEDYPSRAGSAPLNEAQMHTQDRMRFNSNEEMIGYCRAHKDEIVAEEGLTGSDVLRIMWGKTVQSLKSGQEWKGYNPDANKPIQSGNPEVKLTEGMKNDPNSQLQQFLERGRERYREQITQEREHASELTKKKLEQQKK